MVYENDDGMPNYNPNSFMKASAESRYKESAYDLGSNVVVDRYEHHEQSNDFSQVKRLQNTKMVQTIRCHYKIVGHQGL